MRVFSQEEYCLTIFSFIPQDSAIRSFFAFFPKPSDTAGPDHKRQYQYDATVCFFVIGRVLFGTQKLSINGQYSLNCSADHSTVSWSRNTAFRIAISPGGTLSRVESAEEARLLRVGRDRFAGASGVEEAFRLRALDCDSEVFCG